MSFKKWITVKYARLNTCIALCPMDNYPARLPATHTPYLIKALLRNI